MSIRWAEPSRCDALDEFVVAESDVSWCREFIEHWRVEKAENWENVLAGAGRIFLSVFELVFIVVSATGRRGSFVV